jgi:hypothetical protein
MDARQIFEQYRAAVEAGEPADPRPYLAFVAGADRRELIAMIDAYLEEAPRRSFDPMAFRDSPAASVAESVQRSLAGAGGLWPALLPRLRRRRRIRRSDLVAELAARLGAGAQREKVGDYYHRMEQGLLPAAGVSDTVLEALGAIVGSTKDALRSAGELPAPGGGAIADAAAFTRVASAGGEAGPGPELSPDAEEPDEVDRLFRGG